MLIAFDGSEPARAAARTAGALFGGADAVVATAYEPPLGPKRALSYVAIPTEGLLENLADWERQANEQAMLTAEEGRTLAAHAGLTAEAVALPAARGVWPELLAAATENGADVMVCGTRGRGAAGRALLGSVSSSLLHQGHLPLLIVPAGDHAMTGPIVVSYDGSDGSDDAIRTVGRVAPAREVIVAHAWDWSETATLTERALLAGPAMTAETVASFREMVEESARGVAEAGRDLAEAQGLRARAEVVEAVAGTWRTLVLVAQESDASVLVAGSRGRGAVESTILGSVSAALAHHATRPTLITRP